MGGIWDKIKVAFERAQEKALEIAKEAATKTKEQASIATIKIEIAQTEKEIQKNLLQIGSIVYDKIKGGEESVSAKLEEIISRVEKIKELEEKLEDLKKTLKSTKEQ